MKYFISAGEASGDIHAAQLIKALKARDAEACFAFLGGDLMAEAAGTRPVIDYRDMAFMGFCEVARHLRKVLGNLKRAKQALRDERPDALILVDYPSFNLKLAAEADRLGIKTFYYISPKVWAWKERRVKQIRRRVDKVLSILPFEVDFYRDRHQMDVTYVGNPSVGEVADRLGRLESREEFARRHGLDSSKPFLALVAGSRRGEIRNNLPIMDAVGRLHPELQPVIAGAPGIDKAIYGQYSGFPVVEGATFDLVAHSEAALVTSGTATLEAALIGTPQVVCYRANGSRLSYALFKRILKIPFVSLPNLIVNRAIVAEQLLHFCTPELVDAELRSVLPGGDGREVQIEGYAELRRRLTDRDAASEAARIITGRLVKTSD